MSKEGSSSSAFQEGTQSLQIPPEISPGVPRFLHVFFRSELFPDIPSEIHVEVTSGMSNAVFSKIHPVPFGVSSAVFAGIPTINLKELLEETQKKRLKEILTNFLGEFFKELVWEFHKQLMEELFTDILE